MRLYLSSYGFGDEPGKLTDLLGKNKRAAVISNAADYHTDPGERAIRHDGEVAGLAQLGIEAEELDLRDYFLKKPELAAKLSQYGLVWVPGGNSFVLQRAIVASGFDTAIRDLLQKDKIVYGGYSAGACVAAITLKGIDIVDDPNIVPDGYNAAPVWDGLGLIPYSIAPHYKSDHPESADVDRTVAYFEHNNMPFRTLRDGEVIVVNSAPAGFTVV